MLVIITIQVGIAIPVVITIQVGIAILIVITIQVVIATLMVITFVITRGLVISIIVSLPEIRCIWSQYFVQKTVL